MRSRSRAPCCAKGVDRFPAAFLDERAMEIRLLLDHREDLVAERTRDQNRLRWHLVDLGRELEADPARRAGPRRWLERIARRAAQRPTAARVRVARDELRRDPRAHPRADELERELTALVARLRARSCWPRLGCGALTAATLIGRTAGAERFATDGHFARQPAPRRSPPPPGDATATDSTAAAIASSTARCTASPSPAPTAPEPAPTSHASTPKARPARSAALPQAPPRPPHLAPARAPTPTTTPSPHDQHQHNQRPTPALVLT